MKFTNAVTGGSSMTTQTKTTSSFQSLATPMRSRLVTEVLSMSHSRRDIGHVKLYPSDGMVTVL